LAFASLRGAEWRLFTVGLDGGALTEVAAGRQPAWSPDGKRLALVRELDRLPQVHVATLGGTEATCLTRERHNDSPAWSPDGGRIAFASGRAGTSRLLAMSPDGSDQALFADVVASEPAWSPDGRTLAYTGTTQPRHARGPLPAGICLLNVADGGVRLSQSAAMGASPAWSPDGARIVFSRNFRLYVLEIGPDTAAPLGGAEGGRP
jgi:TolB protein